jgi:hypothetical protein
MMLLDASERATSVRHREPQTHSLNSSVSLLRDTSPAFVKLAHACLQRARSAMSSGVNAVYSSPRAMRCLFSERAMLTRLVEDGTEGECEVWGRDLFTRLTQELIDPK